MTETHHHHFTGTEDTETRCVHCNERITLVEEAHDTYWESLEDGDSLSYVPTLHDHAPAGSTIAQRVCRMLGCQ